MFDHRHVGHQVRDLDQLGARIAAGNANVLVQGARLERRDDVIDIYILVAQGDIELVEQHKIKRRIGDHAL